MCRYDEAHSGIVCTRRLGGRLLLYSWKELSEECIMAGWDQQEGTHEYDASSHKFDGQRSLDVRDYPDKSDDDTDEEGAGSSDDEVVGDPGAGHGYGVFES
jgi:hypothetical protein